MRRLILLIICVSMPVLSPALDPQKRITQYVHDVWGSRRGLPQNAVYAIVQTREGYLWLGTEEGMVRFDGVHFEIYDKKKVKELTNNKVHALCEDREGNLWIGTYGGGLTCLDTKKGTFATFTVKQDLLSNMVTNLCNDNRGNLWIGTENGLIRLKAGKITAYTSRDGLAADSIKVIYNDSDGNLWIGTDRGLNRMKDGKFVTFTTRQGLSDNRVRALCQDQKGNLWIGTEAGLNRLKDGEFTTFTKAVGLSGNRIKAIYEDRQRNLWIGTEGGGLNRLNPRDGKITAFTTKEGLSDDEVRTIYEDKEGILWIGTNGGGLNCLKDARFTSYTTREGLSNDDTGPIYEDGGGNLWIGTHGGGLNRLNLRDGTFTAYTTKDGLSNDFVWSIMEDRWGNLWIGTDGGGLNLLQKGEFVAFSARQDLTDDQIKAIYEDRQGYLWIGTYGEGLKCLKDGKITVFTFREGLADDKVNVIYEDREGSLWIGTDSGLNRLKDGKFTTYTTQNGLSDNLVNYIYEDKEGSLWIGTEGGLNRLRDGKFKSVTYREGLFDDTVHQVFEDNGGNLWMSCNKGIFRVRKKEVEEFFAGQVPGVHCVSYDENDGMKSKECNGTRQPTGWKSRDGRLWFPTVKGVVVIDPGHIEENPLAPPVVIESLTLDSKEILPPFNKPVISPGYQYFEIKYTGLSFLAADRVRFKYKLEDLNNDWLDVGTRRTAYYHNIPPGNHTFRVTACNNDGKWNETGASISFYIKPYFYQTWWFYLVCCLGVGFLGFGAYRWRVRQLKKREEELETQVAQRTAQLQKANELARREREIAEAANRAKSQFLARMSHEIRTPMNSVIGFADMLLNSNLNDKQLDFATSIGLSADALLKIIDDILDFSKIEAGKLTFEPIDFSPVEMASEVCELVLPRIAHRPIEVFFRVSPQVPAYVKQDAGRFRQVLVNLMANAVKFTREGEIHLSIDVEKQDRNRLMLHTAVRDTGIGISADKLNSIFEVFQQADGSTTREFGGTGLGLTICKQIANHMGGDIQAESTPGKGSIFHFYAWVEKSGQKPAAPEVPKEPGQTPVREKTGAPVVTGEKAVIEKTGDSKTDIHILLVEDNPINRKLLSYMLTQAGYRLDIAGNGKEAVDKYLSSPNKYSMIFMDVQMPEMDGMAATRLIRESEAQTKSNIRHSTADRRNSPHIPIIAITAQSMKGDNEKCLEAGMNDYISKPIRRDVVLEMVEKWGNKL